MRERSVNQPPICQLAHKTVAEMLKALAATCPFCLLSLKEGAKELSLEVDVKDITEALADALLRP